MPRGVVDTGGKFAYDVVDTGGKSLTPTLILVVHLDLRISPQVFEKI
jgi:translation initiation factor IF-2